MANVRTLNKCGAVQDADSADLKRSRRPKFRKRFARNIAEVSDKINRGGPITVIGKATSSRNSLQHGLASERPILLQHERAAKWEQHLSGTIANLKPVGTLEVDLVRKIAWTLWRMRRLEAYEGGAANLALQNRQRWALNAYDAPPPDDLVRLSTIPDDKAFDKIAKYESHLQRQMDRALQTIFVLQQRRRPRRRRISMLLLEGKNYKTNPGALPMLEAKAVPRQLPNE